VLPVRTDATDVWHEDPRLRGTRNQVTIRMAVAPPALVQL
jgi:hypothetical protein